LTRRWTNAIGATRRQTVVTLHFVIDIDCQKFRKDALYHYTDFTALKSIYEKGEIWATNSQYLNDISEMKLGPKAIMGVLFKPFSEGAKPYCGCSQIRIELKNDSVMI
jgi:hypothetical protein